MWKRTKVERISRQPSPVKIMIDQKQQKNVEYFNYFGNMIRNVVRCICEIKSRIAMTNNSIQQEEESFHIQTGLIFKKETSEGRPKYSRLRAKAEA
jgi:hypothetical protein